MRRDPAKVVDVIAMLRQTAGDCRSIGIAGYECHGQQRESAVFESDIFDLSC